MSSRLSSPRLQRKLLWIGAAVLIAGATALIVTLVWDSPDSLQLPVSDKPAQIAKTQKSVPLDPEARRVGERFIKTAVARVHLAESWDLVAPSMKDGFTLAAWKSGAIPIVPYPADTSRPAPVKVDYSYKNSALLMVLLTPKKGDSTKPQLFLLGLRAFGAGDARRWLVEYWAPFGAPKIPQN